MGGSLLLFQAAAQAVPLRPAFQRCQVCSILRGDLPLVRRNRCGVGCFPLVSGSLCLCCGGVVRLRCCYGSCRGRVALHAFRAHNRGYLVAAGVAHVDLAFACPVVVAALFAGRVSLLPGSVGDHLVNLLLLCCAGIGFRGAACAGGWAALAWCRCAALVRHGLAGRHGPCLGDIDCRRSDRYHASVAQRDRTAAGLHRLVGDRAHPVCGFVAHLFEHARHVCQVGSVLNVQAAHAPVVHACCRYRH